MPFSAKLPPNTTILALDERSLSLPESLSDLQGVEGGAFQQLIAADPERYSVIESRIRPDPADLAIVFSSDLEWSRISLGARIIH